MIIYPAVMGYSESELQRVTMISQVSDHIHIDIMDNVFVPNSTPGLDQIDEYVKKVGIFPWVHAMVSDSQAFCSALNLSCSALVSFHLESTNDILNVIKTIKEKKYGASIAISPKTAVKAAEPFLDIIDQILVMSVEPGFSGQTFLPEVLKKIEQLDRWRQESGMSFRIGVDGGINKTNIGQLAQMGVDDCAVSTGIFGQKDPVAALMELCELVEDI